MIDRPRYFSIPMADGLRWPGGGGFQYSEKKDGIWSVREIHNATLVGEQMRNGDFWAFDVVRIGNDDLRRCQLRDRWSALQEFQQWGVKLVPTGNGGEFLEAVLSRGGEGVVARHLDSYFGYGWTKCKRCESHDCTVTEIHDEKQSVRLAQNGMDCGWCPVFGDKFHAIQPGDIVEIECYSRTASGKFREPRFVRTRPDKSLQAF